MISKKMFTMLTAVLLMGGFSTNTFAELFSFGVGIPVQHTFTSEWSSTGDTVESESVSGAMIHVKFPIMLGMGYETYQTDLKAPDNTVDNMSLTINMLDVFWLTPVPLVNFTVGAGVGTTSINCDYSDGTTCADQFEDASLASAYQWYLQVGYDFLPFLDAHLSYQNVTAKVKTKDDALTNAGETSSFNGTVIGIGVAFIF